MSQTLLKDAGEIPCKLERKPAEMPDSTSQEREWGRRPFTEGEDILVQGQDGLLYFGIVVEVELEFGQCLVRFGDCTERWSSFFELRRLGDPEEELEEEEEEEEEQSRQQQSSGLERLHDQEEDVEEEEPAIELPQHVTEARRQLSYDFESLVWDSAHHRNETETYCYCGESGDWYKKMLQCSDCLQWFHQECIRSLSYQLLCGDRFFEFVCTLCNGKHEEFIRRLDLSLVDSVHLAIFNLILSKNQKFHDLETSILPFMKKKIKYLQGSPNNPLFKASKVDTEYIAKVLATNKSRFKCGSETGKKSSYWGLRKMCPPPLPSKYLSISHQFGRWAGGRRSRKAIAAAVRSRSSCNIDIRRFTGSKTASTTAGLVGKNQPQPRRNRGRCKDSAGGELSDSDASSKGTLDFLIKTPKDFCGANNPFRSAGEPVGGSSRCGGDTTPGGSLRRLLSSDKSSPVSSGAPSTVTTDDSLVEDMLRTADSLEGEEEEEEEMRTPGIKLSDLKGSLSSYFAPSARRRMERGDKFRVKARRLTLNGDIAYLIDWETAAGEAYS